MYFIITYYVDIYVFLQCSQYDLSQDWNSLELSQNYTLSITLNYFQTYSINLSIKHYAHGSYIVQQMCEINIAPARFNALNVVFLFYKRPNPPYTRTSLLARPSVCV